MHIIIIKYHKQELMIVAIKNSLETKNILSRIAIKIILNLLNFFSYLIYHSYIYILLASWTELPIELINRCHFFLSISHIKYITLNLFCTKRLKRNLKLFRDICILSIPCSFPSATTLRPCSVRRRWHLFKNLKINFS